MKSTTDIKRLAPEALLAGLKDKSQTASAEAGLALVAEAKEYGLSLRDYLRIAVNPNLSENRAQFASGDTLLNGYEATLAYLNLPVKDDLDAGIMLQAAADTFQMFPGARALFPEVVDDMVQWKYRQLNFETTEGLVAQSRTISNNEMLTTVVQDTKADYEEGVAAVAEGGQVPIHSIKTSEKRAKFYKFGNGYKTTYEFQRRASLDILTPYALRTQRQINIGKTGVATLTLINGDGVNGAAPVVNASSYSTSAGATAVAGKLSWRHLVAWFIDRAKAGVPIDTIVGNWDMYIQWLLMFSVPTTNNSQTDAENLAKAGFQVGGIPMLDGTVNFKLSSAAPANKLIGYSRGDTLEELVEAGSQISESEKSIRTQETVYVNTETSGYRLIFDDTRSILNLDAG